MSTDTRLPESKCPFCGYVIDAYSGVTHGRGPKPGDITMCLACGSFSKFGERHELIAMTDLEVHELPEEQRALLNKMRLTRRQVVGDEILERIRKSNG